MEQYSDSNGIEYKTFTLANGGKGKILTNAVDDSIAVLRDQGWHFSGAGSIWTIERTVYATVWRRRKQVQGTGYKPAPKRKFIARLFGS